MVKKFGAIGVEIVCGKAQNQGYFTFSNVQASVLAESKIEYGFYRLTEPSRPFYDRMRKEGRVGFFGTIFGPPPPEMAPTLGIIDRTEISPGEFIDGGTIYLYMKLDLGPAPQGSPGHFFDIALYMPNGTWYVTLQAKTDFTGAAEFSGPIYLPGGGPYGIWTVSVKIQDTKQNLFNASFTYGRYLAIISVSGLPSGLKVPIDLDGLRIGEISQRTSIGLGWSTEHTITAHDVIVDKTSRYHASQHQLKISDAGEYGFEYVLQHFLTVESPYQINGSGWFDQGEEVKIIAPVEIPLGKGTRAIFHGWKGDIITKESSLSFIMNGPKYLSAEYVIQHLLTIESEVDAVSGAGWYDEDTYATLMVTERNIRLPRFQVATFVGWFEDSSILSDNTQYKIIMNSPRTITAQWHVGVDYKAIFLLVVLLIAVVIVMIFVYKRNKKGMYGS